MLGGPYFPTTLLQQEILDKKVIEIALLELFIVQNLPFRIVKLQEFQTFCYIFNRQAIEILPTYYSTIATKAKEKFIFDKDIVQQKIQLTTTKVYFSIDIWTLPSLYFYLAICIYFFDIDKQLYNILLVLLQVAGYSREYQ
jgi:hypothetical protein